MCQDYSCFFFPGIIPCLIMDPPHHYSSSISNSTASMISSQHYPTYFHSATAIFRSQCQLSHFYDFIYLMREIGNTLFFLDLQGVFFIQISLTRRPISNAASSENVSILVTHITQCDRKFIPEERNPVY